MAECDTETVQVTYYVDAEFDDQSGVSRFGPVSCSRADDLLIALSARSDCKKATKVKEAVL